MARYSAWAGGVASGTDKTIWNLHHVAGTPTRRPAIYDLLLSCDDTPGDQSARFSVGRTAGVGTEASNFTPVNLDPAGPDGEVNLGQGAYSVEPGYTANKELLVFSLHQRAVLRFRANARYELRGPAINAFGVGLRSRASTSTQAYESTVLFEE